MSKTLTKWIADQAVTEAKLNTSVAGNGLAGGGGTPLSVNPDGTGGSNLARAIASLSTGVAVKVDDSTIGENGSNQLYVPNGGITETQLNSSVAGTGISGGAGTALALDIISLTFIGTPAGSDSIAIYDASAAAVRRTALANVFAVAVQQETVTTQAITGTDTALTDTLNNTPVDGDSVELYLNGILQTQGSGEDYTISGSTITWLASTGTAVDMDTSDELVAIYISL